MKILLLMFELKLVIIQPMSYFFFRMTSPEPAAQIMPDYEALYSRIAPNLNDMSAQVTTQFLLPRDSISKWNFGFGKLGRERQNGHLN